MICGKKVGLISTALQKMLVSLSPTFVVSVDRSKYVIAMMEFLSILSVSEILSEIELSNNCPGLRDWRTPCWSRPGPTEINLFQESRVEGEREDSLAINTLSAFLSLNFNERGRWNIFSFSRRERC